MQCALPCLRCNVAGVAILKGYSFSWYVCH
nr:MAG TPA: hypothetical protein [Caudoviricetes sp.]